MRALLNLFAGVVGAVVVAVVARYGFRTADNEVDGYVIGVLMGAIALGGMSGHAVAVRLWTMRHRRTALMLGLIAACAMTMNLSNSLGALLGRGSDKVAAQLKTADTVRSDRATLARKEAERRGMVFKPVDAEAVAATARATAAATAAREAECSKRGSLCRDREADERKAMAAEADARASKAATDVAAKVDAEIVALKAKIEMTGPVKEDVGHGAALATMFRLPKDMGDAIVFWQNFLIAAVAEFLIIGALIAAEIMRPAKAPQMPAPATTVAETSPPEPEPVEIEEVQVLSPPAPIQIADQRKRMRGIAGMLPDMIETGNERVTVSDALAEYRRRCAAQGVQPVEIEQFVRELGRYCKRAGIDLAADGGKAYLVKARIKTAA